MDWSFRDQSLTLGKTRIMGILNVTPDSFSDGGKFRLEDKAVSHAQEMIEAGADLLDLGAESTRPNAEPISAKEELERLLPVLKKLRSLTTLPISIDTTKHEVARQCLDEGADIINDVSGLAVSGMKMAKVINDFKAGFVLMHRRGNPETMQSLSDYQDVVGDVLLEIKESLRQAFEWGMEKERIVIDPGIGFAKETEDNLKLIAEIEKFKTLDYPILLGPSRKKFIGEVTGKNVSDRDFGTAAVIAWAVLKRVSLVRVHNVDKMKDVIKILEAIQGVENVRTF